MGRLYRRPVVFVDSRVRNDRKLLKLVKMYPILYEKKHPHFKERREKVMIWDGIAKKLNYACGKDAKQRVYHLIKKYKFRKWALHEKIIETIEQILRKKRTDDFTIDQLEEDVIVQLFDEEATAVEQDLNRIKKLKFYMIINIMRI